MKNLNTILNVVCLVAIAILFFFQFKKPTVQTKPVARISDSSGTGSRTGSIAYFEMDTVEAHYDYIKDVQDQLKGKQQSISTDLNNTRNSYMKRAQELQSRAANMSQQEGEAAQAEINQMQNDLQQKEARLSQQLQEQQFKLLQDINKKIEGFLLDYNKDKKYDYIISHSTGDFIYYKDSLNDITQDIIKGLNEQYKKK